jgi:hypothetical protein
LVSIEICRPRPWPIAASKFDDSTRISSIMSAFGDAASRRPVPLLVAPSIEYVLLPTPPTTSPAAVVVPSANPCDTSVCVGVGFTDAANRVSMIGMFEIIGSASTILASNVCAEETEVVSSSGASAVTVIVSLMPPISSW